METQTITRGSPGYPSRLEDIYEPPRQLYVRGAPLGLVESQPSVAVVGTRKVSAYGREVTYKFARQLAKRGIVIISGLALGVDAIAHRAALDAGGHTIAVLPSPVEDIYPTTNDLLGESIIRAGGSLVSEYELGIFAYKTNFNERNRIVAGLANILLITEAAASSGTAHTVRFAMDHGQTVFVVPGNITSPMSVGTNSRLKQDAHAATDVNDILYAVNLSPDHSASTPVIGKTPAEQAILKLLMSVVREQHKLLR